MLVVLATMPGPARAEPLPRVGVVVVYGVNTTPGMHRDLARDMDAALKDRLLVDIMAGEEVERRLPPDGVPADCVATPACPQDIARRLDADVLLLLVILKVGEEIQIDTTWYDASSGKLVARPAIVIRMGEQDARSAMRGVARDLLPGARPRAEAAPAPPVHAPGMIDPLSPAEGTPRRATGAVWIASGVAGVALLGSAGLGLSVRGTYQRCRNEACGEGTLDGMERRALAADLLLGVAGVSALAAALLYLRSGEHEPGARIDLAPGAAAILWGGRF